MGDADCSATPFLQGEAWGAQNPPQNTPKHPKAPHNTPHPTTPTTPQPPSTHPYPPIPSPMGATTGPSGTAGLGCGAPNPQKSPPRRHWGGVGDRKALGHGPMGAPQGRGLAVGQPRGCPGPTGGLGRTPGPGTAAPPARSRCPPPRSGPAQRVSYPHSSWRRRPHCPHPRWRRRRRVTWPGGEVRRGGRRHVG